MRLLIKAELFRIWHRPFNLIAVVIGALFVLFPVIFLVLSRYDPGNYNIYFILYSGFPDGLWNILQRGFVVFPMALAVLAAGSAGDDYTAGTLKIVLPRVFSRARLLLAKHIAVIAACFAYILAISLSSVLLGLLVRIVAGMSLIDGNADVGIVLGVMLFLFVKCIYIGVIGIFVVTLTRSQALGLVLSLLEPIIMALLAFLPGGRFLPAVHLDMLELKLLPFSRFSIAELASVLGAEPNVPVAFVLVLGWILLFATASFVLFERRDVR